MVDQSVGTNKHRTEDDTSDTMPGGEKRMEKEKATKMGLLMACSSDRELVLGVGDMGVIECCGQCPARALDSHGDVRMLARGRPLCASASSCKLCPLGLE